LEKARKLKTKGLFNDAISSVEVVQQQISDKRIAEHVACLKVTCQEIVRQTTSTLRVAGVRTEILTWKTNQNPMIQPAKSVGNITL
jgi:hypothetical protein